MLTTKEMLLKEMDSESLYDISNGIVVIDFLCQKIDELRQQIPYPGLCGSEFDKKLEVQRQERLTEAGRELCKECGCIVWEHSPLEEHQGCLLNFALTHGASCAVITRAKNCPDPSIRSK